MHNTAKKSISLDCSRLPPAPHVLIKLIDLFHQTDVSFDELVRIIEKDTALCSKVISISNSAAYRQWSDVCDLKRIMVVLGIRTVKSIVLTSAVHQFFSQFSKELGETLGSIWLDSLICAHLCRSLANLTGYENPDESHLAGLMHQLGKLVLISSDPDEYQKLTASALDQSALLLKEHERYGIHSADLAADMIAKWGVNSFIHDAVRYQHKPADLMQDSHSLVKLVNLASQLCNRLNHSHKKYLVEDHYFALNQAVIENLVFQATQAAIADAKGFGIKVDENQTIPCANIDDEEIRIELAHRVRQIALLEGAQKNVSDLDDISDMMQVVSENLEMLFGLSSTLFFFPDKEQSTLTGIISASHRKNIHVTGSLAIQLKSGRSLISESAVSKTILSSWQQTLFSELPIIDCQILTALASQQFIALPLIHGEQFMGVIAIGCDTEQADRYSLDNELLLHFSSIIAQSFSQQHKIKNAHWQLHEQKQQEIALQTRKIIHEVNNPLTIINNYLDILSIDMQQDSANKQHLETIKAEVDRVGELLLQLKDAPVDQSEDQPEVDINQLITMLIELFKPTFYKSNHIKSQLELDPLNPVISTDQSKLKQILSNLLKNAAEALSNDGVITVKTKALVIFNNKQYVEITVSDNGTGIPDRILNKLFTPIETSKGVNHSGLGLTIVYKLVMELSGSLRYGTSDHGGAEFIILLPRS